MTEDAAVNIVSRVKSVSLTNYRGFKGKGQNHDEPHWLDTDADIVLITGPNGFGKTSLLEALTLLLTGWYDNADPAATLISSSHHEDMSNHLLDLLVPPPGRSMRLIRFTGWSNTDGPQYEQFTVEPSADINKKTLEDALKDALERL